jgi:hypothetical protein
VGAATCASGKPGVEWEDGHFDGESQTEREEQPELQVGFEPERLELQQVKGAAPRIKHQDRDEHQRAARKRVEEELQRRVNAPRHHPAQEHVRSVLISPAADQEVHRDQGQFPEHVEQHQVQRDKDADHAGFEKEQQGKIRLEPLLDAFPGEKDYQHREERREQHQPQADSVDAQKVLDVKLRHPGQPLDELHAGLTRLPPYEQQEGDGEGYDAHAQGPSLLEPLARQQQQEKCTGQGQNGYQRQ